jgi:hypothetical protein
MAQAAPEASAVRTFVMAKLGDQFRVWFYTEEVVEDCGKITH